MMPHEIERYAVDSTNIKSIGYSDGVCVVQFGNGNLYAYTMTPEEFEDFARAASKGGYFNARIRGRVTGEKLTGKCSGCGNEPEVLAVPCPSCGAVVRQVDKIHKGD